VLDLPLPQLDPEVAAFLGGELIDSAELETSAPHPAQVRQAAKTGSPISSTDRGPTYRSGQLTFEHA
jgi:hypothetical protein